MRITDSDLRRLNVRPFDIRLGEHNDRVKAAADAIHARWPNIVPEFSEADGKALLKEMAERHHKNDWNGARRSKLLVAARVAFHSQWIKEERLNPFREFLIEQFELTDWNGLRLVMFDLYFSSYTPGAAHTFGLAHAIPRCREQLGLAQQAVLNKVPELLDPREAPQRMAIRLIGEEDPQALMHEWGLQESFDGGLMFHLYQAVVRQFEPRLQREDEQELNRFLMWLRPDGKQARQLGSGLAIDAALKHWYRSAPQQNYQARLITGLVSIYGDPRTQGSAAWEEASQASKDLMRRWLTGETMSVFLKAISATNDSSMWQPRRKFWMDLYDNGKIDEAWVAFSDEAYREAQRMATSDDERSLYRSFGRQTAGGGRKSTSLLVMRIGRRIMVEGSHSYKIQLFERDNPNTPRLYEKNYDCERIRLTSDEDKVHVEGSWQLWVRQKVL